MAIGLTFQEEYGTVSRRQLRLYRKFNVSTTDHDMLCDIFGEGARDNISDAVEKFSRRTGMFESFDMVRWAQGEGLIR